MTELVLCRQDCRQHLLQLTHTRTEDAFSVTRNMELPVVFQLLLRLREETAFHTDTFQVVQGENELDLQTRRIRTFYIGSTSLPATDVSWSAGTTGRKECIHILSPSGHIQTRPQA
ncbi:hypothetical protein DP187_21385 [Enterobacter cloacae]|nr:hypothetical protein DP187_21385 [Enterobacter cloacae]